MKAIDLFAGWGGFTLGANLAGVDVVWAANHWPLAVEVHATNHPQTAHVCQDLRQADWTSLPAFELLLASPACQGHSTASQPRRRAYHDAMRSTAWAVVDCADATEPKALLIENVPSFRRWRLYPLWLKALEQLGYSLAEHVVEATAHGVPQRRKRLFIVGLKGRTKRISFDGFLSTEPAFRGCLEARATGWRPTASAKTGARARISTALGRFERCLVQHVTDHKGVSLDEAIRTITTKDHWVLADRKGGGRYRPLTTRELARGMGFPDSFRWPSNASRENVIRGLGNAVCPPVARDLICRVLEVA